MSEAHQIGAGLVTAATVALALAAAWSVTAGRRSAGGRDHRFAVDRLLLLALALVAVNDVVGVVLLGTGRRPSDGLHLLYGFALLATGPVGWWLGGRRTARRPSTRVRRDAWLLGTAVVMLGLELRLFMTA